MYFHYRCAIYKWNAECFICLKLAKQARSVTCKKNPLAFVVEFDLNLSFTIRWERKDKNLLKLYNKLSYARILIGFWRTDA